MPTHTRRVQNDEPGLRLPKVKHSMRKGPYMVSLVFLLAATALTLLNIKVADLVRVVIPAPGPTTFETKYGLYERCTRTRPVSELLTRAPGPLLTPLDAPADDRDPKHPHEPTHQGPWECDAFPTRSECAKFGERFCVLWSSAGYTAQLALVPCLFGLVSLLFIFLHRGKRSSRARARRHQWKLVSGALLIHCLLQTASAALILRDYIVDERFERGARLGRSFWFGIAAAIVSGMTFGFLAFTGFAARRGEPWAAGRSARQARRHKRTRSGRVVTVPEGTPIPPEQRVTVGEVVQASDQDETTALLAGETGAAGGGTMRATDSAV